MNVEELKRAYEERVRSLGHAVEAREVRLAALSAVVERTHSLEDTREILDVALEEVLTRFSLSAGWVFLGRQGDRKLHLAASRGVSREYLDTIDREGLEECLCPEVFWTGHRMQARNTTHCPRMPMILQEPTERVAHACVPLRFESETRGVLNIAARPDQLFTEDELGFFELVGHQVCIAIERAGHEKAERRRNREARALASVSRDIGGSLGLADVLAAVGRSARELLDAERAHIFLGSEPHDVRVAHLSGLESQALKEGDQLDLVTLGARGQVAALVSGESLQVDDWTTDPRVDAAIAAKWGIGAALVLPLTARGRRVGLMVLSCRSRRDWTSDDRELAESFAAQACVAIDNARLYDESQVALQNLKRAQGKMVEAERMATLGTFASGLAHEVRNPLNSISLQLSILERRIRKLGTPSTGEMENVTGIIRGEISRLDALVSDFLLFSRGSRLHRSMMSLDDLVDDVVRLLEPEGRDLGIAIERTRLSETKAPGMLMDAERMKQVLLNLLRNAFEAMGRDGFVRVETDVSSTDVRVSVTDHGPGLPQGIDIFQLFVTTKARGTGLGLAIAHQIVTDHGGDIVAGNASGRGARFTVSLPLTASARAEVAS